ncbi:DNA replication licensing factor MCM2, putative [Ixodes scapularis]|uniref:DNA replication licensing factor MCM2, putative n=1 Tax=Ixodes scapularis TaxID=6945 RepID=B7PQN9_IXOSC|nr:DNA replication licensing factor MCM2, putative [Ixodes scapularis]|eukprot:XP_002436081.1 DNA replication licensing factor MCM2, putative [Ixodes scapularis]
MWACCASSAQCVPPKTYVSARRQLDLNQLVRTADVGKTRTADLPHIYLVKYNCNRCDYDQGPFVLWHSEDLKPGSCPECHSYGTFTVKKKQVRRGIIC